MTESELDLDAGTWLLPGERSKNHGAHLFHLAPLAKTIIAESPRVANPSGFLFSTNGQTAVSGFSRAKIGLDELMLDYARKSAVALGDDPGKVRILPWVLHDLRRTLASGMARLRVDQNLVEARQAAGDEKAERLAQRFVRRALVMRRAKQQQHESWQSCCHVLRKERQQDLQNERQQPRITTCHSYGPL
jgi:integrase